MKANELKPKKLNEQVEMPDEGDDDITIMGVSKDDPNYEGYANHLRRLKKRDRRAYNKVISLD